METSELNQILQQQKTYFASGATLPVEKRKAALQNLKAVIRKYEPEILSALQKDLGKSQTESFMAEVGMTYEEITYMLRHLDRLAAPIKVPTPVTTFGSRSEIIPIPYGTVLIMSPWNYPFLLTMQPLVDALAAGNTAVVKPSAYSPHVSQIMEKVLMEAFSPEYVSVVLGGRQENQALLDMKFDYIFFTGSVNVGKTVMAKASQYLTPVTLELGGKSPCIVDETANIALAAKRIVFGKYLNAGQTCVCPDYILVQESVHDDFIQQVKHQIAVQYPTMQSIGKIINEKHFNRIRGLLDPEKTVVGGIWNEETLQIAPTVLDHVSWDDPVMQEEIFGPVMPVLTYTSFEDILPVIRQHPTPLATYLFSRNPDHIDLIKYKQPFGSGCINDTIVQLSNHNMPFGGMGESGMGQYHGKFGFYNLSHMKSMLTNNFCIDIPLRYAPYSTLAEKAMRLFMK